MQNRRLVLNRESLTRLDSDELSSVSGAASTVHPLCLLTGTTSAWHSWCATCDINCTWNCATS